MERFFDERNHTFFLWSLQTGSNKLVGRPSNFSIEIPTQTNNAESKVEKFPTAVFITTSARRPAHLLT